MKFVFDGKQQYQIDAIDAVVDLFRGQPKNADALRTTLRTEVNLKSRELKVAPEVLDPRFELDLELDDEIGAIGNNLLLNEETILENLQAVQNRNGLEIASSLVGGLQFDVEMETGTGKTYVYLRTILELAKRYSFRKFIILVPSVAIREGVNTSISLMKEHFRMLYPEQPFDSFVYSGKSPEDVRSFATSTGVQIMVMTIDSVRGNKNTRIIHQQRDRLNGLKPIEFLQSVHPIVIMDEPQNMESLLSQSAIDDLNPLCTLRYSATHRRTRNVVYRLDPVDAHDLGLVKQIVVAEAIQEGESATPFIKLVGIRNKPIFQARLELLMAQRDGSFKRRKKWVSSGDDLEEITKNPAYGGNWRIDEISLVPEEITLTNYDGVLRIGEEIGGASRDIYREMIRETVREHLRKAAQVNKQGVKVLSLFFVDKVASYLGEGNDNFTANGDFAVWFDRILDEERARQPEWAAILPGRACDVRSGYFAQMSKGKGSEKTTTFVDSSGSTKKDDDAYELIMKDKARLLSMDEPVQFIFSHSALREGWDNPNVFQICTLREMGRETERRQTIGRGLRLPVKQSGQRLNDKGLAQLTVIANESYREFAAGLQEEYRKANIAIGYVRKGEFSKITIVSEQEEICLGFIRSAEIFQHLEKSGFVNEKGVIQPSFQPKIRGFSLNLPEKYSSIEDDVISRMLRCQAGVVKPISERVSRRLNKEIYCSRDFEVFWDTITARTTFRVKIDKEELISSAIEAIKAAPKISPIQIRVTRAGMEIARGGTKTLERATRSATLSGSYSLPDIVGQLQQSTSLTRETIIDILLGSDRLKDFMANPNAFMIMVRNALKSHLASILVDGVQYEKIKGSIYELRELQDDGRAEKDRFIDQLYKVRKNEKTDFDYVVCDSYVERQFAELLDSRDDIKLFMKLPDKFKIDTPVGAYNPDWAIIKEVDGKQRCYMIRETKGSLDSMKRRPSENAKINSALKHFAAIGVDYEVGAPGSWGL